MSLDPILNAPFVIQLHAFAAVCAVILGPIALLRRSRDNLHKAAGYVWVLAMAVTALSSFGILSEIGPLPVSPIHVLSVFTLWSLWRGITAIRERRIGDHQKEMRALYFWAIGVAGLFTFLPGRRMNSVFFSDRQEVGFAIMAILIGGGLAWYSYASRRSATRS